MRQSKHKKEYGSNSFFVVVFRSKTERLLLIVVQFYNLLRIIKNYFKGYGNLDVIYLYIIMVF